jgi:hypothetical protein
MHAQPGWYHQGRTEPERRGRAERMFKEGCPGSAEIRSPSPENIGCPYCGAHNEIWSDETETTCDGCGKLITREMKESCVLWCPSAKECVGAEKYEQLVKAMGGKTKPPPEGLAFPKPTKDGDAA